MIKTEALRSLALSLCALVVMMNASCKQSFLGNDERPAQNSARVVTAPTPSSIGLTPCELALGTADAAAACQGSAAHTAFVGEQARWATYSLGAAGCSGLATYDQETCLRVAQANYLNAAPVDYASQAQ